MAKKKKTFLVFLMLITFLYGSWTTVKGISQEFNIPIPILVLLILLLYLFWKEEE
jgi:hypothetical protein